MSGIRLMNRTDTKFVTSTDKLELLLEMARDDYFIQEIDGKRNMEYFTVYFDSPDFAFFRAHHDGHCGRQKVRMRTYVESKLNFLEIKTKDNHGKTRKQRMALPYSLSDAEKNSTFNLEADTEAMNFLHSRIGISPYSLDRKIENGFHRITLVNRAKTERLTIDTGLKFHNLTTGINQDFQRLAIIELKRDGLQPSPVLDILRQLRIHPSGFSKYCIGEAMTNPLLRQNRFKSRIRKIMKLVQA